MKVAYLSETRYSSSSRFQALFGPKSPHATDAELLISLLCSVGSTLLKLILSLSGLLYSFIYRNEWILIGIW